MTPGCHCPNIKLVPKYLVKACFFSDLCTVGIIIRSMILKLVKVYILDTHNTGRSGKCRSRQPWDTVTRDGAVRKLRITISWGNGIVDYRKRRGGEQEQLPPQVCAHLFSALARKSFDCDMPVSHLRGYTGRHFFAERMHKEKATPICQLEFGAGAVLTEP